MNGSSVAGRTEIGHEEQCDQYNLLNSRETDIAQPQAHLLSCNHMSAAVSIPRRPKPGPCTLIQEYAYALKGAFSEVFDSQLVEADDYVTFL